MIALTANNVPQLSDHTMINYFLLCKFHLEKARIGNCLSCHFTTTYQRELIIPQYVLVSELGKQFLSVEAHVLLFLAKIRHLCQLATYT